MQHDEVIWQVIRHNHCSFMAKITAGNFCRNPNNVTGLCNRSSCPLANSRYATIRDHDGVFYLYMKTIERAHKPNQLWERLKLPRNYEKALELINKHMMYWPQLLVHKTKQRLTKMTQMRIRMRKLALKTREKVLTLPRKESKREARRAEKAEKAAVLDKSIERELLERLNTGVYGEIYNYPVKQYMNILDLEQLQVEGEEEEEPQIEFVEGEYEEEDDIEDIGKVTLDPQEDHEEEKLKKRHGRGKVEFKKPKKPRVIVEVPCVASNPDIPLQQNPKTLPCWKISYFRRDSLVAYANLLRIENHEAEMQNDEVIWQTIRHNHCSFMTKTTTGNFCTNPYNVTGICNRSSCPLANSRYATIREHDGVFYLYMKTIERAHKPNKLWERLKLPRNYEKAMELINKHMMYWPKLLVHKTKQRLTKMTQMRIRMRTLALKTREKVFTVPTQENRREARRAEKAEKAAALDKEYAIEYVEGYDELEEEDDIEDFGNMRVDPLEDDDDEVEEEETTKRSLSDSGHGKVDANSKKKRVMVEVEHEDAFGRQKRIVSQNNKH
ncbi:Protein MAK16 homolog B [Linum grandiflorum]